MLARVLHNIEIAQRERIAGLEEQIRQLNDAFAPKIGFPAAWGLRPKQAMILSALYSTRGSYITGEALKLRVYGFDVDHDENTVRVTVFGLRKKLEPFGIAIETRRDEGYALTPEGRGIVGRALGVATPAADVQTQPAPATPKHHLGWSEAEEAIVRAGYEREATLALIRIELKNAGHRLRSLGAISVRAQQLGLTNVRSAPVWTKPEDDILRDGYADGDAITQIRLSLARAGFRRNRGAIQMRAIALGVAGDRVHPWTQPEKTIVRAGLDAGLTYDTIRDRLRKQGYERGRTSVAKLARSMGVRRAERPWTAADVEFLRRLYAEKLPQREIAKRLDREVGGIASKASKLGFIQRVRWSEEERARLVRGFEAGERLCDVAREIGRPYINVYQEARRLGLKFAHTLPAQAERAA